MERAPYSYRNDAAVPAFPDDRPVIIFDGKCVLCSRFAQFVLRRDRHARFRMLAAQSPLGQALYRHFGLDPVNFETNVLLENGRAWIKWAASIRIISQLGFPWSLLTPLQWIPARLFDPLYNFVARNRLRWFGSRAECFLPDAADQARFLD
jgi:predicted DCC family thiol-disulfide oxidoreductase YuxK